MAGFDLEKFLNDFEWDEPPEIPDALKIPVPPKVFDTEIVKKKLDDTFQSIRDFRRGMVLKDSKSLEKSLEFFRRGERMVKAGLLENAINLFTKAVAFAPENSLQLGFAYSSRSDIFFKDGDFFHSLIDTNRSLECDIPQHLKDVLLAQKMKCVPLAREELEKRYPGQELVLNLDAADPFEMCARAKERYDPYPEDEADTGEFPKVLLRIYKEVKFTVNKNPETTPYTSMQMKVKDDMKKDDIICVEKLLATTLDETNVATHCDYCLERCFNMIPCITCTKVLYCGKQCRENALKLYHRVECKIINFYGHTRTEWLAFRAFLGGTVQGKNLKMLMEALEVEAIFKPTCRHVLNTPSRLVNSYAYTLWLSGQFTEEMLAWRTSRDDTIRWVVQAIIALQEECFFEEEYSQKDHLTEKELYAALLLLNNFISLGRKKPLTVAHKKLPKKNPAYTYIVCCWQDLLKSDEPLNTDLVYIDRHRMVHATRDISANERISFP